VPLCPPPVRPFVAKRLGLHAPCIGVGVDLAWAHERVPRPTCPASVPATLARLGWAYDHHMKGMEAGTYWHVPPVTETVLDTGFHSSAVAAVAAGAAAAPANTAPAAAGTGAGGAGGAAVSGTGAAAAAAAAPPLPGLDVVTGGGALPVYAGPPRVVSRAWGMGDPSSRAAVVDAAPLLAQAQRRAGAGAGAGPGPGSAKDTQDSDEEDAAALEAELAAASAAGAAAGAGGPGGAAAAGAGVRRALEQAEARAIRAARALESVAGSGGTAAAVAAVAGGRDSLARHFSPVATGTGPAPGVGVGPTGSVAPKRPSEAGSPRRRQWTLRPAPKAVADHGRVGAHCVGVQVNVNAGPAEGRTPLLLACER
jgi:hypothetical protein